MASLIVTILLLVVCLVLIRRWFPWVYNLMKRVGFWSLKGIASWLWSKAETKGGANVRPARMRWRE